MKNVLIVDDNKDLIKVIKEYFKDSSNIKIKYEANDGKEAINIIKSKDFDIIVLDLVMPHKDGFYILNEMNRLKIFKSTIISTSFYNNNIIKNICKYNIEYILAKPYDIKDLENVIMNVESNKSYNYCLKRKINSVLHRLGIPSHIKGYQYIIKGIELLYSNPYLINNIMKDIYPKIANEFNTTSSKVEGAMRHAIDICFNRGDLKLINELFGNTISYDKAKVSNSEFIKTLSDTLRLESGI